MSAHCFIGLIPAHAGKTRRRRPASPVRWAHPRSRGENKALGAEKTRLRLIPAHAGKTENDPYSDETLRAHPRSRGENLCPVPPALLTWGSSPLTRGKPVELDTRPGLGGLIPAHAGKTRAGSRSRSYSWAHPRSRGENSPYRSQRRVYLGSSPLTRGKRTLGGATLPRARLIPAHAGKTLSMLLRARVP